MRTHVLYESRPSTCCISSEYGIVFKLNYIDCFTKTFLVQSDESSDKNISVIWLLMTVTGVIQHPYSVMTIQHAHHVCPLCVPINDGFKVPYTTIW